MKKNQFALIFLTLIVMLAVWYIKSPLAQKETGGIDDNSTVVTSSRLDAIKNMRDKVIEERSVETSNLDAVIASAETSLIQKENALNAKKNLSNLTEKEVLLELKIINMGYEDAFVHSTDAGVNVIVVAEKENDEVVLEIINSALESFQQPENVIVTFKKNTEL